MRGLFARALRHVKVADLTHDSAVGYSVVNTIWGTVAGIVTIPLILSCFTPELQGYFYTFRSILGVQTLIVLGLGQVIQQFASHEMARIRIDAGGGFGGDPVALSRLADLRRFAVCWYSGITLATIVGMGWGGYWFISRFARSSVPVAFDWVGPWFALSVITGVYLFISPALVFLDSVDRVAEAQKLRLFADLFERVALWSVILAGGRLWVFFISRLVGVAVMMVQLIGRRRTIFRSLFRLTPSGRLNWKREILPLQWRYAVTSLAGYVNFSLLNPILFAVDGPETAGRMGMTWSVLSVLWGACFAIVSTKMPRMSMAASRAEHAGVDRIFRRIALQSSLVLITGVLFVCLGIGWLGAWSRMADRFLPLPATLVLGSAIVLHHLRNAMMSYIRAYKLEPFWVLGVLEIVLAGWILPVSGRMGGATGISLGFACIALIQAAAALVVYLRVRRRLSSSIA